MTRGNSYHEPDCPCFETRPSYGMCKKCAFIKTCVMPCLDKNTAKNAVAPVVEKQHEIQEPMETPTAPVDVLVDLFFD